MLVPMSVILGSIFADGGKNSGEKKRAAFPMYVLYFIIAGIVASTGLLPENIIKLLGKTSSYFDFNGHDRHGSYGQLCQPACQKGQKALVMGAGLFAGIAAVSLGDCDSAVLSC